MKGKALASSPALFSSGLLYASDQCAGTLAAGTCCCAHNDLDTTSGTGAASTGRQSCCQSVCQARHCEHHPVHRACTILLWSPEFGDPPVNAGAPKIVPLMME